MKNFYEGSPRNFYGVGNIYIWQNLTGSYEYLNGKETTVVGDVEQMPDGELLQETDTKPTDNKFRAMGAFKGALRPKNPPNGEKSIHEIISGKLNINIEEEETA